MSEIPSSLDQLPDSTLETIEYASFFEHMQTFVQLISELEWQRILLKTANVTAQTLVLIGSAAALGELSRSLGDSEETVWLIRGLTGICVAAFLFFINVNEVPLEWIEENPQLKKLQQTIDHFTYRGPYEE